MYQHYILTRMNLGIYNRADAGQWMRHRLGLFESYLLPSIMRQTNNNFRWILCFDERTPDEVICRYDYMDHVIIAYQQPKFVVPTLEPDAQWLITSRIDNDDFYFPEFVQTIQDRFEPYEHILDVDYYQWDNRKGKGGVYSSARKAANSPFITLIERWDNARGVCQRPHNLMPNYFAADKIGQVLAVQMITGYNVLNKIRGVYLPNVRL